ncbi:hypothetical protein TanjilG_31899 [Lupinus angustifolius]|uniref:Uncharacterized protein n=1 Tax=Lupinus angustifolius TaxID=3871 RepID=A0A1J7HG56_LUPAN|nr:hypothetical protein TanjilG_31899 [Lupinus angustifolius]
MASICSLNMISSLRLSNPSSISPSQTHNQVGSAFFQSFSTKSLNLSTTHQVSTSKRCSNNTTATSFFSNNKPKKHQDSSKPNSERVVKQIKVKVREVNNLPIGLCIIVDFDEQGAIYGDAQGFLAGFLGTLASDCKLFPIDYDKWSGGRSGIPSTYFTEYFDTIIKV